MDNSRKLTRLYNELQEKWTALKYENNAHTSEVRGYEHVDVQANYYKMQMLEEVMETIDKLEEA